jgi:hypothetical protein
MFLMFSVNFVIVTKFPFVLCVLKTVKMICNSIFVISATGIIPQSLFKNLKILDLDNTLVVEIQKGILLYSCHIVRKFLNIDTEHNTQQSQNAEARRR